MIAAPPTPTFFPRLARTINSGLARSIVLAGEVHDLFFSADADGGRGAYVPLVEYLCDRCAVPGLTTLVYELNGPIRVVEASTAGRPGDRDHALAAWASLRAAWVAWQLGATPDELTLRGLTDKRAQAQRESVEAEFNRRVTGVVGHPTLAMEFLRQLTLCSRSTSPSGRPYLTSQLLILVEAADMMVPPGNGDVTSLPPADRHRISIVQDWFSDPGFVNGPDTVVLLAESPALIHPRVTRLPLTVTLTIDPPDQSARRHFIDRFVAGEGGASDGPPMVPEGEAEGRAVPPTVKLWADAETLARTSAGMSLHALRQLLVDAAHREATIGPDDVIEHVADFLSRQLGEDVIEFKRPTHRLDDVVGATRLKSFLRDELIPRVRSTGRDALPGAAVAGPIGGGKTYIFEAVAAELDLPVLVLKNIRSQWFGQTDVIFERLRAVLGALEKVVIFVDEADTQFGGVGAEAHATERRLTGKVQQMMSDPSLRGRVIWLLMTARIHRLSADIRRPGRVGDLIIPVLDPEPGSADRRAFIEWSLAGVLDRPLDDSVLERLDRSLPAECAADFASIRSRFTAVAAVSPTGHLKIEDVESIAQDQLPPAIGAVRRYQTLQALINCTRRSLLPDVSDIAAARSDWARELAAIGSIV